jgi:uncharacterized membrane protein YhaH (DUF805 family)
MGNYVEMLMKSFVFRGRTGYKEYWEFALITILICIAFKLLSFWLVIEIPTPTERRAATVDDLLSGGSGTVTIPSMPQSKSSAMAKKGFEFSFDELLGGGSGTVTIPSMPQSKSSAMAKKGFEFSFDELLGELKPVAPIPPTPTVSETEAVAPDLEGSVKMSQRMQLFIQALGTLPEYEGWEPHEIDANVRDVLASGDSTRTQRFANAIGRLSAYDGRTTDEILGNVRDVLLSSPPTSTISETTGVSTAAPLRLNIGFWLLLYVIAFSIIPLCSASVRRLHDVGHSGKCLFWGLIPIFGIIILLSFLIKKGDIGDNKYGSPVGHTYLEHRAQ